MKKENQNKVGVYIRISKKTDDVKDKIENQKQACLEYLTNIEDSELYKIYVDEGISSFSITRPAYDELIEDIFNEKVNCVLIKDFSRIHRDTIKLFDFIHKFSFERNIRFISILNDFDSTRYSHADLLRYGLQTIYNQNYSIEISEKTKAIIELKQKQGEYVPSHLPFGYKKDRNSDCIVQIDESVAPIIRKIFQWYLNGDSIYSIVKRCNLEDKTKLWTQNTVRNILNNDFYCGTYRVGKTKQVLQDEKRKIIPPEEHIVIENKYPSIISKDVFLEVNNRLSCHDQEINAKSSGTGSDVFRGKVICAYCNRKMKCIKRTKKGAQNVKYSYICTTYASSSGTKCCRNTINSEKIHSAILFENEKKVSLAKSIQQERIEFANSYRFEFWQNKVKKDAFKLQMLYVKYQGFDGEKFTKTDKFGHESTMFEDSFLIKNVISRRIENIIEQSEVLHNKIEDYWTNDSSKSLEIINRLSLETASLEELIDDIKKIKISKESIKLID